MKTSLLLLFPLTIAFMAGDLKVASAAPKEGKKEIKARLDREVDELQDKVKDEHLGQVALKEISRMTGVPLKDLEEQRTKHNTGFPALLLGHLIVKESHATFADVMAQRRDGRPWSQIAENHKVDPAMLLDKLLALKRHLREVEQKRK